MPGRHRMGRETKKKQKAKEFFPVLPVKPPKAVGVAKVVKGKRITPLDDRD